MINDLFLDRYIRSVFVIFVVIISVLFILRRSNVVVRNHNIKPENKSSDVRVNNRIRRVVDGDTLILASGETVRLIGVDAPELHHPEVPVQRFAEESAQFLRSMAEGFSCTLEYDSAYPHDKYGRLLAYVWAGGKLLNAEIIRRGYGYAYTRFPHRRMNEFVELERKSRQCQYGLWNFSLNDGKITDIVKKYGSLSIEGRAKLDEAMAKLAREYPLEAPSGKQ